MRILNISLESFWFGGNYTDKTITSISGNVYEVKGKKRYTNTYYRKKYTSKYVNRILGDNIRIDY